MEVKGLRIDEHVFEGLVRKKVSDHSGTIKILETQYQCISEKGMNFLSDLFEVCVKYAITSKNEEKLERSMYVMLKVEPLSEFSLDLVRRQDLFLVELQVLRDVLPRATELLGSQVGPRLWYGCENPRVLIMENLKKRMFTIKSRQKGLSYEHCCLVMEQLARLHAGSVAVYEKDPQIMELFKGHGIVTTKCPQSFFRLMEVSLLRVAETIQKWPNEKCASSGKKLIKLVETIGARCLDVYNYDSDEFCVLNHGDCWMCNMMFKEDEKGQPTEVLLVDYQMSTYTSPAIDLLYFLNICPEITVKYDNDDRFLEIYLNTLTETMKSIGCKTRPPTIEELKTAMHKRRVYAIFSGIILHFRMMAKKEDTEDFTEVLEKYSGESQMDVFENPDTVKLAHKMIPVLNERGYFD